MFKFFEKNRWLSITLALILAVFIFYTSSWTTIPAYGKPAPDVLTTLYHIIVFFLFSLFLFISIKSKNKIKVKYIVIVIILSILYAISDEFHQAFVPGRNPSIIDIMYDASGIFSSIFIYSLKSSKKG